MANDAMDLTRVSVKTALEWVDTCMGAGLHQHLPENAKREFTVLADGLVKIRKENTQDVDRWHSAHVLLDLDTVLLTEQTAGRLVAHIEYAMTSKFLSRVFGKGGDDHRTGEVIRKYLEALTGEGPNDGS